MLLSLLCAAAAAMPSDTPPALRDTVPVVADAKTLSKKPRLLNEEDVRRLLFQLYQDNTVGKSDFIVRVLVDEQGKAIETAFRGTTDSRFESAVRQVAPMMRFSPAQNKQNEPVKAWTELRYKLETRVERIRM